MSERLDRMLVSSPTYYETSPLFQRIQEAQGNEFDSIDAKNADLAAQLRVRTATWGLRYYEEALDIPTVISDSLAARRGRVLSKQRSPGNFSAALVRTVAESFVNGQVDVTINIPSSTITIKFVGPLGVPEKIADVRAAIDSILHAHLAVIYSYRFLSVEQIGGMTIGDLGTKQMNLFSPVQAGA